MSPIDTACDAAKDSEKSSAPVPQSNAETNAAQNLARNAASDSAKNSTADKVKSTDKYSAEPSAGKNSWHRFIDSKEKCPLPADDSDWDEDLLGPKPRQPYAGLDGAIVVFPGIVMPALLFVFTCLALPNRLTLVALNHPLETLAEMALLLLVPVINYSVWSTFCRNKLRRSRLAAFSLGLSTATGLLVSAILGAMEFAAPSLAIYAQGITWFATFSALASAASAYILYRIRAARELNSIKRQIVACAAAGAIIAPLVFALAEARPWLIRHVEQMALSSSKKERNAGLRLLHQLSPEHELHLECGDMRAAGLAGIFMPIKQANLHQLYFGLTGTPYSFHETNNVDLSSMPDDYLSRNVVGDEIAGLSLARSTMSAVLHPRTASGSVYWTFVFKNDTAQPHTASAELLLPPGAIIDGVRAWKHGNAADGSFVATDGTQGAAGRTTTDDNHPVTINDLGRGRVLFVCQPISPDEEFKVRLGMALPLKPDSLTSLSSDLPRFVAANFTLEGDHQVNIRSSEPITSSMQALTRGRTAGGEYLLAGDLGAEDLKSPLLTVGTTRKNTSQPIAAIDKLAIDMARQEEVRQEKEDKLRQQEEELKARELRRAVDHDGHEQQVVLVLDGSKAVASQIASVQEALSRKKPEQRTAVKTKIRTVPSRYVLETFDKSTANAPKTLVVVIDGSMTMTQHIADIRSALSKIPSNISTRVIIASSEKEALAKPVPLEAGLALLKESSFSGGQDNLKYVVKAAELAGQSEGGAVLWIHGPQPSLDQEIYPVSPYVTEPAFFEVSLGSGTTDTAQLFENHPEIGPFTQVQRSSRNVGDDLGTFFSSWKSETSSCVVNLTHTNFKPSDLASLSDGESDELIMLHASRKVNELLAEKHRNKAAYIATAYGFVSPVSMSVTDDVKQSENIDAGSKQTFDPFSEESRSSQPADGLAAEATQAKESISSGGRTYAQTPSSDTQTSDVSLQGATNGTIGPQGTDATVISGINTAGTVRVNNLANLEALLNIVANMGEIVGLAVGGILVLSGFMQMVANVPEAQHTMSITRGKRICIGGLILVAALALPGIINWFVASARDANLFS